MVQQSETITNRSPILERLKTGVPDINIGIALPEAITLLDPKSKATIYVSAQPHDMVIIWKANPLDLETEDYAYPQTFYITEQQPTFRERAGGIRHTLAVRDYLAILEKDQEGKVQTATLFTTMPMDRVRKVIQSAFGEIPDSWSLDKSPTKESSKPLSFTY